MNMKIAIIGGGGHVGLPLSITLADASEDLNITIIDINKETNELINSSILPFKEDGADIKLKKVINKNLFATDDLNFVKKADVVIVIIGTPVDEYLNPSFKVFKDFIENSIEFFSDNQTVILRSTVYPGTSQKIHQLFNQYNLNIHVAFCPERIAEGKAMIELYSLPQIISGFDEEGVSKATEVFRYLTKDLVYLQPMEAELAKLFTNSWRYIQFATANQYYMLAESMGLDFYKIYHAMTFNYPRTKGFPKAGFAAGPCLFKDTMQLSSVSDNQFFLGHSAMLINEGLPNFIVKQLKKEKNIQELTVGILGMAFKAESDDKRTSLSYKLKNILEFEAKKVLCTDTYIKDPNFLPLTKLIELSDILILATPHQEYKNIQTPKEIIDVWNFIQK
ncbi:MAG: UDP-N-acetyl-D-mannosamine dehydrogenase [Candidatus Heimdallarchaeota archaeon LC_3]|nr:MAG: UDP-N-acetyl-D-mannosamine dehydrogenase [Candidatus Heimdallarchaeota archaeon LC_3]